MSHEIDLKSLARLGAQTRLAELVADEDAILGAFPDLQGLPEAKPKRSRMSPAQRKAVSQRMTRYWEERRKAAPKTVAKGRPSALWTPAKRRAAAERARRIWTERRRAKK